METMPNKRAQLMRSTNAVATAMWIVFAFTILVAQAATAQTRLASCIASRVARMGTPLVRPCCATPLATSTARPIGAAI